MRRNASVPNLARVATAHPIPYLQNDLGVRVATEQKKLKNVKNQPRRMSSDLVLGEGKSNIERARRMAPLHGASGISGMATLNVTSGGASANSDSGEMATLNVTSAVICPSSNEMATLTATSGSEEFPSTSGATGGKNYDDHAFSV